MLRVNLTDLDRAGAVRVRREIPAEDPLWTDLAVELGGPVTVDLEVTATATGQVVARGTLDVLLVHECRRCLTRVERPLTEELTMVWSPPDELDAGGGDEAEIRSLTASENELELGQAIREELVLAVPRFVVCTEDCRGLCPRCGINRNIETCDCTLVEPDPRWDALRDLEDE